jgi:cell division septal protein FtsQ
MRIGLICIVVLATAGGVGWIGLQKSGAFTVDTVVVSGTRHADPRELERIARSKSVGHSLIGFDVDRVRRALLGHPWVADAVIRRDFPDTLRISITEADPVLRVRSADPAQGDVLLDEGGRVMAVGQALPPVAATVPRLEGAMAPPALAPGGRVNGPLADAAAVAGQLPPRWRTRTASIGVLRGAIALTLEDGPIIRVGTAEDIETKLRVAAELGRRAREAALIDVSVPSRPITRENGTVPSEADAAAAAEPSTTAADPTLDPGSTVPLDPGTTP